MPKFGITAPFRTGDEAEGFYQAPQIDGVSNDEVARMEQLPLWTCNNCSKESPAKARAYMCNIRESHKETYFLCRECRDTGAKCESDHDLIDCQFTLECSTEYFYKRTPIPKRHLRVLHIRQNQSFNAPLEGLVDVLSVDEPHDYNTLSYVWGSQERDKLIKIGHCLVPITSSLEMALRRFRAERSNGVIWVDAICINQQDNSEKAAQISMMRDIYRNSNETYVYLGEHDDSLRMDLWLKYATKEGRGAPEGTPEELRLASEALQTLMRQPWFTRVWVIQEVAASLMCKVFFGNTCFDFKILQEKVQLHSPTPSMHDDPFITILGQIRQTKLIARNFKPTHLANAKRFWLERQFGNRPEKQEQFKKIQQYFEQTFKPFPYPLIDLLESFRNRAATNPRDKIYALLGIATDISWTHDGETAVMKSNSGAFVPQPDYDKPVKDVYYDFGRYFIENGNWCDVLHSASLNNLGKSRLSGLPSWVPDWTSYRNGVQSKRFNEHFGQYLYHAGGLEGSPDAFVDLESRGLSINGVIVDAIAHVSTLWKVNQCIPPPIRACIDALLDNKLRCWKHESEDGVDLFTIQDALISNALGLVTEDCESCTELIPLWLQSVAVAMIFKYTRFSEAIETESRKQFFDLSNRSWQAFKAGESKFFEDPIEMAFQTLFDPEPFTSRELKLQPNREYIHEVIAHRRFCVTEQGRLGLVPLTSEVGDVICVMKGGTTPYILRPDGEDWLFVGDSYIRGIMRGETCESDEFAEMRFLLK